MKIFAYVLLCVFGLSATGLSTLSAQIVISQAYGPYPGQVRYGQPPTVRSYRGHGSPGRRTVIYGSPGQLHPYDQVRLQNGLPLQSASGLTFSSNVRPIVIPYGGYRPNNGQMPLQRELVQPMPVQPMPVQPMPVQPMPVQPGPNQPMVIAPTPDLNHNSPAVRPSITQMAPLPETIGTATPRTFRPELQQVPEVTSEVTEASESKILQPVPSAGDPADAVSRRPLPELPTADTDRAMVDEFPINPHRSNPGVTAADRIRSLRQQASGDTAFRNGDYAEANEKYHTAMESAPGRRAPWLRMTWAMIGQQEFDQAVRSLKTALVMEDDPGSSWIPASQLFGDDFADQTDQQGKALWDWVQQNPDSTDRLLLAAAFQQLRGYDDMSGELLNTAIQSGLPRDVADALTAIKRDLPENPSAQAPIQSQNSQPESATSPSGSLVIPLAE
ncbi:MAG: hypothetical protein R3C59_27230 [Planctomycetaceae bacterium]